MVILTSENPVQNTFGIMLCCKFLNNYTQFIRYLSNLKSADYKLKFKALGRGPDRLCIIYLAHVSCLNKVEICIRESCLCDLPAHKTVKLTYYQIYDVLVLGAF